MDPICGNCGNPKSKHYAERELYCNTYTNGDIFTDTPSDELLFSFINEAFPSLYDRALKQWQIDNGHLVP